MDKKIVKRIRQQARALPSVRFEDFGMRQPNPGTLFLNHETGLKKAYKRAGEPGMKEYIDKVELANLNVSLRITGKKMVDGKVEDLPPKKEVAYVDEVKFNPNDYN